MFIYGFKKSNFKLSPTYNVQLAYSIKSQSQVDHHLIDLSLYEKMLCHGASQCRDPYLRELLLLYNIKDEDINIYFISSKYYQVKVGDAAAYECVNIYKQPAFDHPLLKNHKIQMKPSSLPKGVVSSEHKQLNMVLQDAVRCPEGTVPIRKTRTESMRNTKSLFKAESVNSSTPKIDYHKNSTETFYGSQATMNVINPRVDDKNQASLAFISLWNGSNGDENLIQAGWGAGNSGCYNLQCSGFVHVDKNRPLGQVLDVSTYDGKIVEQQVLIHQDSKTKNWWVTIAGSVNIGYWPNSLLPHLANGSPNLSWGSLVKHDINGKSPQMGFGYFPDGNPRHAGYFRQIQVMYNLSDMSNPAGTWETYEDKPNCYKMVNYGLEAYPNGYSVVYGGTGGACDN
ncbi:hypothetical protein AQUCO_00300421v1 [Aquilegia coerulea]|uniref:Neprosin PEP catalytic domain-containing protein n=1 Tax=Aquilegia coerulea TaxID=218851 RepID=A0A2G5EYU7_AQUCA|nr:hypothetical protein AQUCO_00300421v1 [Aquilegia coerulea]PIA60890.1 hypothetical protein AQUCO_00300421v1 [Aquilegia coerulea]